DTGSGNPRLMLAAARKRIVGERRIRAHEDIVFQRNPVPELYATLDGDAITHHDIVFDERVVADVASGSNSGTAQDVSERPYASAVADCVSFDDRCWMLKEPLSCGRCRRDTLGSSAACAQF